LSLKAELIHGKAYDTRQQAMTAISEYIEVFYNRQRRHSYRGYLSPVDFEKKECGLINCPLISGRADTTGHLNKKGGSRTCI
jgi:hypothetical protein